MKEKHTYRHLGSILCFILIIHHHYHACRLSFQLVQLGVHPIVQAQSVACPGHGTAHKDARLRW